MKRFILRKSTPAPCFQQARDDFLATNVGKTHFPYTAYTKNIWALIALWHQIQNKQKMTATILETQLGHRDPFCSNSIKSSKH